MAFEGLDFGILNRGVPPIDPAGSISRGLQLRQLMQAKKDDETMRELSQQAGGNLPQLADLAQGKGLYKQAGALREQHLKNQKEVVTIQETLGKIDKQKRDAIYAGAEDMARMASWAKTPEDFNNGLIQIAKDHPILGGLQQGADGIPMLPEKLQKYRVTTPEQFEPARALAIRNALPVLEAIKTLAPKIEERSGLQVPVTTDVTGQQTVGAPVGVKAQDPLGQLEQDVRNGIISQEDAFARRKLLREGKPAVQVNMQEKAPAGYRWGGEGTLEPIPGGPANKEVPSGVVTAFIDNEKLLGTIKDAIAGVKKYPDAIGFKTLAPDAVLQRMDPEGAATRALIAQVGSLKYKDMSGAAVTVSEDARMAPYIPKLTDSPGVVATKLSGLAKEIQRVQSGTATAYREGHRLIPQFRSYLGEGNPQETAPVKPAKAGAKRADSRPYASQPPATMDDLKYTAKTRGISFEEVRDQWLSGGGRIQ